MGRTAAPPALQLINGRAPGRDSGGRKVPKSPEFRRIPPRPPTWMSREAKAEWKRVVPGLTRLGLLKEEDRAALTVYCETWATYVDAIRDVRRNGLSITTETGAVKRNPAVVAASEAAGQLRGMAQEFGLTPSAELKLARPGPDDGAGNDDDPFA
ncbi:terminase small subunit [Gordonia phage Bunnybear]|uniref:Terminase small subunit n=1 Tax=Gordonia phage Bunnybear TaxID=2762398 RepID=A0A7G8LLD5_9CAUD|nr:terminase small subunit [Gordonia phage Bunnybear]QNJ58057.1 terminase small subunit [Gordonia phage Bunnybear]